MHMCACVRVCACTVTLLRSTGACRSMCCWCMFFLLLLLLLSLYAAGAYKPERLRCRRRLCRILSTIGVFQHTIYLSNVYILNRKQIIMAILHIVPCFAYLCGVATLILTTHTHGVAICHGAQTIRNKTKIQIKTISCHLHRQQHSSA